MDEYVENHNEQRVLARVKRLGSISPLSGADYVQAGQVDGWITVVPKTYNEGDLGVFMEIDSVLPNMDQWVIDAKLSDVKYVKTRKIRGLISQGIFLIMSSLPERVRDLPEDTDVTTILGITKHIPADESSTHTVNKPRSSSQYSYSAILPQGPPKTDESRIQSHTKMLTELNGKPWVATLKYDGCSITFHNDETDGLVVLSRNLLASDKDSVYWKVAEVYSLTQKTSLAKNFVFQGEVIGPKVNGNRMGSNTLRLAIFSVWDKTEKRFLDHDVYRALCKSIDLPVVDEVARGDSFDHTVKSLLELAKGNYENTKHPREGLVVRPLIQDESRISFKIINNDFLLKTEQ